MRNDDMLVPTGDALDLIMNTADERARNKAKWEGLGQHHDSMRIAELYDRAEAGALGEWVTCVTKGVPWVPARHGQVDIPPDVEVRTTSHPHGGLAHYVTDKPQHRFALVHWARTGDDALCGRLVGWQFGWECRRPEWIERELWQGWRVPQRGLRHPQTLDLCAQPLPIDISMRERNA